MYSIDHCETYALVVKLTSIQCELFIEAHLDLEVHEIDLFTAFLNGKVEEDVYM